MRLGPAIPAQRRLEGRTGRKRNFWQETNELVSMTSWYAQKDKYVNSL
jgi:hypothetical protein